jgi:hypothetical protein
LVRGLLVRGLLLGLLAGVLAFAFAKLFGEPQVDKAIAFEDAQNAAANVPDEAPLVTRGMQASWGLLTGMCVFSVAMGGLFALGFAAFHERFARVDPKVTSAVLGLAAFLVLVLVPFTKYPSNPPAVGDDNTIEYRTRIFLIMIAISIAAAVAALRLGRDFVARWGAWYGVVAAVGAYVVLIAVAQLVMPGPDETPQGLATPVIWHFRVATLGIHVVLWTTLGLGFGPLAAKLLGARRVAAAGRSAVAGA